MNPDPNCAARGGMGNSSTAKDDVVAKKKVENEDLSYEDLALKLLLELYVERVQDPKPGLQKVALESNLVLLEDSVMKVVETLKDCDIKALVNTADHLDSVAFKVNDLLDEKVAEVSRAELRLSCIEQGCQTGNEVGMVGR